MLANADDYFWAGGSAGETGVTPRRDHRAGVRVAFMTEGGEVIATTGRSWEEMKERFRQDTSILHAGTINHRSSFESHGRFDELFEIEAD